MRRSRFVLALLAAVVAPLVLGAFRLVESFPYGTYGTNDGQGNAFAIRFDSSGTLTTYVNNDAFASQRFTVKDDQIDFLQGQAPPDYACVAAPAKYKWKLNGDQLVFALVEDSCDVRSQSLTGLAWKKQ